MKKLIYLFVVAIMFSVLETKPLTAQESNSIEGTWHATWETPAGTMESVYTFILEGEVLKGKVVTDFNGHKNQTEIKEGKINGTEVSFKDILAGMGMEITYNGKLENNEIKFTRKVGDFGTEEAVAKRIQD